MNDMARMKELISTLQKASKAYYQDDAEIMSNYEYDKLYDELLKLEGQLGTVLAGSPTVSVGYEAMDELPKETHESPMLSLDKTKEREVLKAWLKGNSALLSWKLDGLTIVLTYENGMLQKAVTRGNGEVGEVITNNARTFKNLPLSIPYKGELVLRGEAVISYADFEKINEQMPETEVKYKNPRNLCSGSVRQLNNEITARRNVRFYAFSLVKAVGIDFENKRSRQMEFMRQQGFETVEYHLVTEADILERIQYFEEAVPENEIPSDGLVLLYEDIAYGQSLGRTSKFPRNSIAFKWADEIRETTLLELEWSPSRTGLINPVAIFEPVELEGTTVSRASVHNVSIVKSLQLGIGDTITVYKANMIIPQIEENLTRSSNITIPDICPACGGRTEIKRENDVETLCCINSACSAKKIKAFTLFVSRDALKVEGLSEATLEKFIAHGFIHEFSDIFKLSSHKEEICKMEGLGEKSYQNLMQSIEKSRKVSLPKLIYSLGIFNVGLSNAKMLCKEFAYDLEKLRHADVEHLSEVDGVGEVIAKSFAAYFADEENSRQFDALLKELEIEIPRLEVSNKRIAGKTFVITGGLEKFESRSMLKDALESQGGKTSNSISTKTDYLINNDLESSSSKNKKAKELGIPIISEEQVIEMLE
ncbi:MAG: NAD-dependent DNA ligase LigA [Lachnospiraceae bacterium]